MRKEIIIILFCAFVFCFCAPAFLVPTEQDVNKAQIRWTDANMQTLKAGRHLYLEKCGKCHYLYRPSKFPEEKWKKEIFGMQMEAKIDSAQAELILRYILTMKSYEEKNDSVRRGS